MSQGDRLVVRVAGRAGALASRVEVAGSIWARFRGLMGRRGLEPGEGMWFPGDTSIHMFFMRFPIDAVFLGRTDDPSTWSVVAIRTLRPWRDIVLPVRGARGCLELPAGTAAAGGLAVGDAVTLETG